MTESTVENLLPTAIATAEATLRHPDQNPEGIDRLRASLTTVTTFDAKKNPRAAYRLAVLLSRLELHAEAERLLDWLAWRTSRGGDAWLATENVRAILAAARGDRERAATVLDLALRTTDRLSVTSAKLHANLAQLCLEVGERARAARHATAALTAALTSDRPEDWPADLLASAEASALLAIERSATEPPRTAEELRDLAETQWALAMRHRRLDLIESAIEVMEVANQHLTARLPATHPEAVRLRDTLAHAETRYVELRASVAAEPGSLPRAAQPVPADPVKLIGALFGRTGVTAAQACDLLLDRYLETVFRFVYYRVGDRVLAEALTSATFTRALHRIDSFAGPVEELGSWLIATARGTLSQPPPADRPGTPAGTTRRGPAEEVTDPGHRAEGDAADLVAAPLLVAVRRLDPRQQDALVLRFLQDFSVPETARALGRTESAVRALTHRAVRALARLLPLGPPLSRRTVARQYLHQVRQVLRKLLWRRQPGLFRDEGDVGAPAARPGVVHGSDRLLLLGLDLRTIPSDTLLGPEFPGRLRGVLLATAVRPTPGTDLGTVDAGTGSDTGRNGFRILVPRQRPAGRPVDDGHRKRRARRRLSARRTGIAGIGLGVVVAVSMVPATGESAGPGGPPPGATRYTERAQLALATSEPGRGHLFLRFARTRLHEVTVYRDRGVDLTSVLDEMDADTRQGSRLLTTSAVQRQSPAALDAMDAFLDRQHRQAARLLAGATPSERVRVTESVRLLDAVRYRVDGLRTTLNCAAGATGGADTLGPLPTACGAG